MKKVTRFFSLLLAIAMVLAMNFGTLNVMADGETYEITINGTATGHTYSAYQIFAGTLNSAGSTLTNVTWGDGIDDDDFLSALKASEKEVTVYDTDKDDGSTKTAIVKNLFISCTSAQDVADALALYNPANSTDCTLAEVFAEIASDCLTTTKTDSSEGSSNVYTISGLSAGYYLIKDTGNVGTDDTYTDYILRVVADVQVTPKSDKPTVEKKVDDKNDSTTDEDTVSWKDSADYDIGDTIPYQLTATLGSSTGYAFLDDYSTYSIIFVDELSSGLTAVTDDTNTTNLVINAVYVTDENGDRVNVDYDINSSCYTATVATDTPDTGKSTITITFSDIKTLIDTNNSSITVEEGYSIVVEYSAVLNDDAVIGSGGNPNTVYLEYSNNPNGSGTGTTTTDTVTVFTFKLTVNKTQSDGTTPLSGANFTLYKFVAGYGDNDISLNSVTGGWKEVDQDNSNTTDTSFAFKGLDDGYYKIVESTTPDGYNSIDDIYIRVTSTHTEGDTPELTALTTEVLVATLTNSDKTITTASVSPDPEYYTTVVSDGSISTTVKNYSGAELPSTGGMGTKIFYTLGGVLVLGAGVLLIVKRRMRNA